MLELAILGLLTEAPLHGYELKKRLGETLGHVWGVSFGSLYPALARLERMGAIEVVDPPAASAGSPIPIPATGSIAGESAAARLRRPLRRSGRTRKAYRISTAGRELFTELLQADPAPGSDENSPGAGRRSPPPGRAGIPTRGGPRAPGALTATPGPSSSTRPRPPSATSSGSTR